MRLGEYDFTKNNETRSKDFMVKYIYVHDEYDIATYENDIAIVRLDKPTTFNSYVWPICLPPRNRVYENENVTVAGWGQVYFAGPPSEVLLEITIPIWNQQKCIDSHTQRITDTNLCAAAYEGGKDSCQVR